MKTEQQTIVPNTIPSLMYMNTMNDTSTIAKGQSFVNKNGKSDKTRKTNLKIIQTKSTTNAFLVNNIVFFAKPIMTYTELKCCFLAD